MASEERVRELQDVAWFASATKNSGLNFREFRMEQYFPIDFFPKYLEFSDEWLSFQNFNNFLIFCKLSKAISISFVLVSKFSELLVECKTPGTYQYGLPKTPVNLAAVFKPLTFLPDIPALPPFPPVAPVAPI